MLREDKNDTETVLRNEEEALQKDIEEFLALRGLELSKEKTHITHIRDGFDFLGFNFRKYPNNKVIVKPTNDGIKSFKSKVKEILTTIERKSIMMLPQILT